MKTLFIYGKGPSLDRKEWHQPAFAVNEAAYVVPNCSAVCKDLLMIKRYQEDLNTSIVIYHKYHHRLRRLSAFTQYPMGIDHCHNSICLAIEIGIRLGFGHFVLYGCDMFRGINGYADIVMPLVRRPCSVKQRSVDLLIEYIKNRKIITEIV